MRKFRSGIRWVTRWYASKIGLVSAVAILAALWAVFGGPGAKLSGVIALGGLAVFLPMRLRTEVIRMQRSAQGYRQMLAKEASYRSNRLQGLSQQMSEVRSTTAAQLGEMRVTNAEYIEAGLGDLRAAISQVGTDTEQLAGTMNTHEARIAQVTDSMEELRSGTDARLGEAAERTNELAESVGSRVGAMEQSVAEIGALSAEVGQRFKNQTSQLRLDQRALESRIDAALHVLRTAVDGLGDRFAQSDAISSPAVTAALVEAAKAETVGHIDAIQRRVDEIETAVADADAAPLQRRVDEIEAAAAPLQHRVDEIEAAAAPLQHRVDEIEAAAAPLQHRVDEIEAAAAPLQHRVDEIEAAAAPLQHRVDEIEAAVATADAVGAPLQRRVDEIEAAVAVAAELQRRVDEIEAAVATADAVGAPLQRRVDEIEAAVAVAAELQRRVDEIEAAVANADAVGAPLQLRVDEIEAAVAHVSSGAEHSASVTGEDIAVVQLRLDAIMARLDSDVPARFVDTEVRIQDLTTAAFARLEDTDVRLESMSGRLVDELAATRDSMDAIVDRHDQTDGRVASLSRSFAAELEATKESIGAIFDRLQALSVSTSSVEQRFVDDLTSARNEIRETLDAVAARVEQGGDRVRALSTTFADQLGATQNSVDELSQRVAQSDTELVELSASFADELAEARRSLESALDEAVDSNASLTHRLSVAEESVETLAASADREDDAAAVHLFVEQQFETLDRQLAASTRALTDAKAHTEAEVRRLSGELDAVRTEAQAARTDLRRVDEVSSGSAASIVIAETQLEAFEVHLGEVLALAEVVTAGQDAAETARIDLLAQLETIEGQIAVNEHAVSAFRGALERSGELGFELTRATQQRIDSLSERLTRLFLPSEPSENHIVVLGFGSADIAPLLDVLREAGDVVFDPTPVTGMTALVPDRSVVALAMENPVASNLPARWSSVAAFHADAVEDAVEVWDHAPSGTTAILAILPSEELTRAEVKAIERLTKGGPVWVVADSDDLRRSPARSAELRSRLGLGESQVVSRTRTTNESDLAEVIPFAKFI